MSRWLVGSFDPGGRAEAAVVAAGPGDQDRQSVGAGPLQVAFSGAPASGTGVLCLLDGHLDNAGQIERELGVEPGRRAEELLAAAYRRWGAELPGRMRGDFVLLAWDREREEGLLARDQLGTRPCFLQESGGVLRFASEIRGLLAVLPRRPAPDPVSVAHWVATSSRPGAQTLYEGVRRLRPGAMLRLDSSGARERRYWAPRYEEPLDLDDSQLAAEARDGLELAVGRTMAAPGATGVLMSGGLDSSSIAALAADRQGGAVLACSAVFPEHPAADESELIADLRQALGLPGVTAEVRPGGLLASALEHLRVWQVPLPSWGDFWSLPLMRAARARGVEVMLDGDGGDNLFRPRSYLVADLLRAGHPLRALAAVRELPGAGPWASRRALARAFGSLGVMGSLPYAVHNPIGGLPSMDREVPRWLGRRAARDLADSSDPLAWKRLDGPRWWAYSAHELADGIDEAGLFEHGRRRAALAGLEVRHPILDLDLVEFGLRQPPGATLDHRFDRPVLRAAVAGMLPDAVRLRPQKAWFQSLIADCLAGPDGAAVKQVLTAPDAQIRAYVDQDRMRRELFEAGGLPSAELFRWMWRVWRLLTIELWLRFQTAPALDPLLDRPPSQPRVKIRA
jgi:asparagine synthase (glutamine-hydrolysing)